MAFIKKKPLFSASNSFSSLAPRYKELAYRLFGEWVKKREARYVTLTGKLGEGRFFQSYDEYITTALLSSTIIAVVGAIAGFVLAYILVITESLPTLYLSPDAAAFFEIFTPYKTFLIMFFLPVICGLIFAYASYKLIMVYPSINAYVRKTKIDAELPHAIAFLYSMSLGGSNILQGIQGLARRREVYGEVSEEFAIAIRDMEMLGYDFTTALKNLHYSTASDNLRTFIENMISLIESGGDINEFLFLQTRDFQAKASADQKIFLELLGLIAESYVTGFVAGPLFIIIVGIVLGSMQSYIMLMMLLLTYAVIPLGSLMFILIIDLLLPKEGRQLKEIETKKGREYGDLSPVKDNPGDSFLAAQYKRTKQWEKLLKISQNPFKAFLEEPHLSFFMTVPVAIGLLAIAILSNINSMQDYVSTFMIMNRYIVAAIFITFIPFTIFYEISYGRRKAIEETIPHFLKRLSSFSETGANIEQSIKMTVKSSMGAITEEAENLYRDVSWGNRLNDTFIRFANRLKTSIVLRVVTLIISAVESTSDIRKVLDIAYRDMTIALNLRKERYYNMFAYIIIIYIAFLVFLYVIFVLSATFLPQISTSTSNIPRQSAQMGLLSAGVDITFLKIYLYHTAIIQGFFSGLLAGQMGEGDIRSGVKHSLILTAIALITFALFM